MTFRGLITDGGKRWTRAVLLVAGPRDLVRICWWTIYLASLCGGSVTFVVCLARILFLLLASLPFLTDLFEFWPKRLANRSNRYSRRRDSIHVSDKSDQRLQRLLLTHKTRKGPAQKILGVSPTFWSSLVAMRLHCHVCVEMVQCSVCLFATIPATFVHSLNLLVSSSRSFVLLRTGDWHEGVNLCR